MTNPNISRVTKEDIAKEIGSSSSAAILFSVAQNPLASASTEFIKKLKPKHIEEFFNKYDLLGYQKFPSNENPEFVLVSCKDFDTCFSDFASVFAFRGNPLSLEKDQTPKFNLLEFFEYCNRIEQAPETVLGDLIAIELFGHNFSEYASKRHEIKERENRVAFKALPKTMQNTLRSANEMQENRINSNFNKNHFGSFHSAE